MPFNFRGGIHPDDRKGSTYKKLIEEMKAPEEVIIPLVMHKGVICSPIVEIGDKVKLGQKIAESTASFSAPIHSSVSGEVTAIEPRLHPNGNEVMSIVIRNDFEDTLAETPAAYDHFQKIGADELISIVDGAGIVGLGGSAYPLSEKIRESNGRVDTLIINGAECEPYITSDDRIMIEYAAELYDGAMITGKAIGVKTVVIAIQSNKPKAIAEMRRVLAKKAGARLIVLHTKYPQGAERQVVLAATGREVPPGKTSADVGAMVMNASTAVAVANAVREGKPLTHRVVTVAGSAVANPKNLLVRIGTPIEKLFDACGGFLEHPEKVIVGGPLMGNSQYRLDVPVIKGTNAVLAFAPGSEKRTAETTCIHCGKCVGVCPMNLMPLYIRRAYKSGKIDECIKLNASDCTECGCCSYICPAKIPLVAEFRVIKQNIEKMKESEAKTDGN